LSYDILVVEDNKENQDVLKAALAGASVNVSVADDGAAAINAVNTGVYDAILLDLELPCVSGMEVLSHARSQAPLTPVIILTGSHDVRLVVEAMNKGAHDYLTKPFNIDQLMLTLERAFEFRDLKNSATIAERLRQFAVSDDAVIGTSQVWLETLARARDFARSDLLVFLSGETGSGKEVLAHYIHRHSLRKDHPFVVVDCGSIPDSLVESELFGHERGAYTGAETSKEGLVELAHGGTLFLDEIGHIDLRFQQKILKFVETKTFRRVGDTKVRSVDVRIIAATNKSLPKEIEAGRFRSDLWYRLNVMKLDIPPLRQRPEDIPVFIEHICRKFTHNGQRTTVSPAALQALRSYAWPGNVRELQSTIQRALAVSFSGRIEVRDLGLDGSEAAASRRSPDAAPSPALSLRDVEKGHILSVLRSMEGNITRSAKVLGIGRNTLHAKLKEYQITATGG
jgi:DNA-binding NtrC family response regulator